jgi:hypothetical protein
MDRGNPVRAVGADDRQVRHADLFGSYPPLNQDIAHRARQRLEAVSIAGRSKADNVIE